MSRSKRYSSEERWLAKEEESMESVESVETLELKDVANSSNWVLCEDVESGSLKENE